MSTQNSMTDVEIKAAFNNLFTNTPTVANPLEEAAKLPTGIVDEHVRSSRSGNNFNTMDLVAQTGHPGYSEFVPGYKRADGRFVDDRFTISVITQPAEDDPTDRRYASYRVTFWGKTGRTMYDLVVNQRRSMKLALRDLKVSEYFDSNDVARFSLSANWSDQVAVLANANAAIDEGLMQRAAAAPAAASRANAAQHAATAADYGFPAVPSFDGIDTADDSPF